MLPSFLGLSVAERREFRPASAVLRGVRFLTRRGYDPNFTHEPAARPGGLHIHSRGRRPGAARLRVDQAQRWLWPVRAADRCAWGDQDRAAVCSHGSGTAEGGNRPL
nr:hypothetical protein SHINE37_41762 [Rhizobiaceae bacterium]